MGNQAVTPDATARIVLTNDETEALTANGYAVDVSPERFGELETANDLLGDPAGLRAAMSERGYLFFRGLLDREAVLSARHEVLQKYAIVGEIDDRFPLDEAVGGGGDAVPAVNLRAFSKSVRSGYWYTNVTEDPNLIEMYEGFLKGDVHCYDMRWPRFVRPGEGCGFHCDGPYMNRATSQLFSSWIPLGRVRRHEGALMVLEGSHRNERLHAGYLRADADVDELTWLDDDPSTVQDKYGERWLTADFEPGDVLCFTMHTLHGALDNRSTNGRCRLSSDTRYQRADEPADPRWNMPGEHDPDAAAAGAGGRVPDVEGHGGRRVFYPGMGTWNNVDFQDEWKRIDEFGRLTTTDA